MAIESSGSDEKQLKLVAPKTYTFARVQESMTKPFSLDALTNKMQMQKYSQESVFDDPQKAGIARKELYKMLEDAEISQAIETRTNAIAALDFRLEGGAENDNQHIYAQIDENKTEIVEAIMSAKWMGFAVPNIVWKNLIDGGNLLPLPGSKKAGKNERVGIETVITTPVQDFTISADNSLIHQDKKIQDALNQDLINGSLVVVQHQSSPKRPHGRAVLASLYVIWCIKQFAYESWAKFCDRFGTPFLVGKLKDPNAIIQMPDGTLTNDTMLSAMNRALDAATRGSAISIGAEDDVSMLEAGGTSPFESLVSKCEAVIQKVVLGQTLTSDNVKGGSNALGQVHDQVRRDKRDSDLSFLQPYIQKIVNNLWRHNEFAGDAPRFYWQVPLGLNEGQAARDAVLLPVMAASKIQLTKKYFVETFNYKDEHLENAASLPEQAAPEAAAFSMHTFAQKKGGATEAGDYIEQTALVENIQPISTAEIIKVVQGSASEEDMLNRLTRIANPENEAQFAMAMNSARVVAEMMGYLSAKERSN